MVRNFGKGGKGHRKMKNSCMEQERELLFKDHDQEYAIVNEMLGSGRLTGTSSDDVKRLCIIRGSLRSGRTNRIKRGDIILLSLREYQVEKADVVHVYTDDEVKRLVSYGEIPSKFQNIIDNEMYTEQEDDIEFNDI